MISVFFDKKSQVSGFMLERTARRMKQGIQLRLQTSGAGITVDQWLILQELDRKDGLSPFEIAEALFKDRPTVTRIIDLLCEKGLTKRIPDPVDRRRFRIVLTEAGRSKVVEVTPLVQAFRRDAWKGLSDEDMDKLVYMLNVIFENLT